VNDQDYTPENPGEPEEGNEPVVGDAPPKAPTLFSNRAYDLLKQLVQVVLPGVGALYFTLASIWGFPAAEQVVGTIAAVTVFLGLLLGLSTKQYNNSDAAFDGSVNLAPDYENEVTNVGVSIAPAALESGQKTVRLRVRHQ